MIRALVIATFLAVMPVAAAAQDGSVRDRMIDVLRDDGFTEIRISNTFLGRLRLVATKPDMRREIVVNPNTGVILRDYVRFLDVDDDGPTVGSGGSGGSGSGGARGNYEDGNDLGSSDDGDDDDDDDESGSDDDGGDSDDGDDDD